MPSPRPSRALTDELSLQAQAVDLLAIRVAVSGALASDVRARALGVALSRTAADVAGHVGQRRDVVVPALAAGETGEPLAGCLASGERVLALLPVVARGTEALLAQTAGVGVLQELGIAVRSTWSALVDHERLWTASAAPLARRRLAERTGVHRGTAVPEA